MGRRGIEMFQYRAVLVRPREGDTDRDIARAWLQGRLKAAALHAVPRMFEQGISEVHVPTAQSEGEGIAAHPYDTPYPSRLPLGRRGDKPLHVVATYNAQDDEQIVVTVCEHDPAFWEGGFRRRRQ